MPKKQVRHPWDKWFKRKRQFSLLRGQDYKCQPHSMAQQIRNAAFLRGLKVSVQIQGGMIWIQNLGEI